jgi:hypothetical protein
MINGAIESLIWLLLKVRYRRYVRASWNHDMAASSFGAWSLSWFKGGYTEVITLADGKRIHCRF